MRVNKRRILLYFVTLLLIVTFLVIKLQLSFTKDTSITVTSDVHYVHQNVYPTNGGKSNIKDTVNPHFSRHFKGNKNFLKGWVLDSWFEVCLKNGIEGSLWHPLFPRTPQHRTILQSASSNGLLPTHLSALKRIYGYLSVDRKAKYGIRLRSAGSAELLIYETKQLTADSTLTVHINPDTFSEIHYLKSHHQRSKKFDNLAYSDTSEFTTDLKATVYFVELLVLGPFELYWQSGSDNYTLLNTDDIFHSKAFLSNYAPASFFSEKHRYALRYPITEVETRKYNFFNLQVLPFITTSQPIRMCSVHKLIPIKVKHFNGIWKVNNVLIYPKEYFKFTDNLPEDRLLLKKQDAMPIVNEVFKTLNVLHKGNLELQEVIQVHTNRDGKWKVPEKTSYHYVELHVQSKQTGRVYQTSHFVQKSPHGLCFRPDYQWNAKAEIYLLTPVKNQFVWVKFLLQMLQELCAKTKENKVTLVLLDSGSTDGNYTQLLSQSSLKTKYIHVGGGRFSKVTALNIGIKEVNDTANNIAMVMDLHLDLPLDFFDRTRKLTIRGKTAFSPTLLRHRACTHEMYTDLVPKNDKWQDDGPGIMAMYLSDWNLVGGFNEKMFANKWGGEDWELVDRIVARGIHIIHYRLPRFIHLWHSRKGMWDKKT